MKFDINNRPIGIRLFNEGYDEWNTGDDGMSYRDELITIKETCNILNHKAIDKLNTATDENELDKLSKINNMVCEISSLCASFNNILTDPFGNYDDAMDKMIENFINNANEILDEYFNFIYSIDN